MQLSSRAVLWRRFIYEIASLAIRSGIGLLLKGGKEAKRPNAILHKVITSALPETVGTKLIGLLTSREEIPELLKLDDVIDLVIPRGSNKLVSQIKNSTKFQFLVILMEFAMYTWIKLLTWRWQRRLYWMQKQIIQQLVNCNAMETLLVHNDLLASGGLQELVQELEQEVCVESGSV